jgi:protein SCO1/2
LRLVLPLLAVVAVVAGLVAFGAWQLVARAPGPIVLSEADMAPSPLKGFALRPDRPAPDFTLTDPAGQPWHLAEKRGHAVALFFGYTNCPDVCPQTLQKLAVAADELGPLADRLDVALVTVDPERDTPEALGRYTRGFHPSFTGLSGEPATIQRIAADYGVEYMKELPPALATEAAAIAGHDEAPGDEHADERAEAPGIVPSGTDAYTVAHSGVVFLIDPAGRLVSSFLGPFDPAEVAHDVRYVLGEGQDPG